MKKPKWQRREEKLNNRRRQSQAAKINIPHISKRDTIIVKGYKNDNPKETFEVKIKSSKFDGRPEDYKPIKEIVKGELKSKFKILEIVTG